jgi:hypothetical protein
MIDFIVVYSAPVPAFIQEFRSDIFKQTPQTPPPRGRVHHPASFAPDILWRGAVQVSSSGLVSKRVRILYFVQ